MNKKIEQLKLKAASLTRQTHDLGIPVMIVFEGVPASGKTRLSNELLLTFDAKYTQFISTKTPDAEDLRYQFYKNIGIHCLKKEISISILEVGILTFWIINKIILSKIIIKTMINS